MADAIRCEEKAALVDHVEEEKSVSGRENGTGRSGRVRAPRVRGHLLEQLVHLAHDAAFVLDMLVVLVVVDGAAPVRRGVQSSLRLLLLVLVLGSAGGVTPLVNERRRGRREPICCCCCRC